MSEFSTVSAPKPKFPPAALLSGFLKKALESTGRRVEEGGNPPVNMAMKALGLEGAASGLEKLGYEGMSGAVGPKGALINTTAGQPMMNQRSVETLGAVAPIGRAAGAFAKGIAKAQPHGQLNAILLPEEAFSFSTSPGRVKAEVGGRVYRNVPEGESTAFQSINKPIRAKELYPNLEGTKIADTWIVPQALPRGSVGAYDSPRKTAFFDPLQLRQTREIKATLDHELTHAGQAAYGEPWRGSSPQFAVISPSDSTNMEALRNFSKVHNLDPEIRQRIVQVWGKSGFVDRHNLYQRDPGEVLARTAEMIPTGPALRYFEKPEVMQNLVRQQSALQSPLIDNGTIQQEDVPALLRMLIGYHPSGHNQQAPAKNLMEQTLPIHVPIPTDLFSKGLVRSFENDLQFKALDGSFVDTRDFNKLSKLPPLK